MTQGSTKIKNICILKSLEAASFLKQNKQSSPFYSLSLEKNKIFQVTEVPNYYIRTSASVSMETKLAGRCVLGQRAFLFDLCSYHLIRQAKTGVFWNGSGGRSFLSGGQH
jgi:hypothetical protein